MKLQDLILNKKYAVEIVDTYFPIIIRAEIIKINIPEEQYNFKPTNNYRSRNDGILIKSLDTFSNHTYYKVYPENIIVPYDVYQLSNRY